MALRTFVVVLLATAVWAPLAEAAQDRVLLVTEARGFVHDSIPAAEDFFVGLGERSARYDVVSLRGGAAELTGRRLRRAAAVVFANTSGELPLPDRPAFRRFVRRGGAFLGTHSASDTLHGWPAFEGLLGGEFERHGAVQPGRLLVARRQHPVTSGLPRSFTLTDEFYEFRAPVPPRDARPRAGGPGEPRGRGGPRASRGLGAPVRPGSRLLQRARASPVRVAAPASPPDAAWRSRLGDRAALASPASMQGGSTRTRGLPAWSRRLLAEWRWLPLVAAAIYVVFLLAHFKGLVQANYLSADVVAAPVLAELSDDAPPGSEILLGNFPWYEGFWLETLTRSLPGHRQIWQLAPWLLSLAGVALVAWSAWRAAGRWAAAMVAVALGCANTGLLSYQLSLSIHSLVWVHAALLGAFLTLAAARGGLVGRMPVHVIACVALAAVTALGVASDKLLVVAGIVPLALAGIALAFLIPGPAGRRLAASAIGVAAGSVLLAIPVTAAAHAAEIRAADFPITFANFDRIAPNVRRSWPSRSRTSAVASSGARSRAFGASSRCSRRPLCSRAPWPP